ncbi:DUF6752 domain-containing protein [Nocardioides iriomotensis]|uniref:DUF6752 domain-containing protein n=1 Tax=Nocardioides iriomotensis TaxID=715784 RepID=A0A4Q5J6L3_9ACTN|nr:DUF6752 domain-containing protein [Nocardioides iriomotensis]RYU14113.1 hypothetical protein ETU37_04180 [Nocardioides iriomotensis]
MSAGPAARLAGATLGRVAPDLADDLRRSRVGRGSPGGLRLRRRVRDLEREVDELRQLSRRLADVLDVVEELLVPALDREDARVRAALERLG